MLSSNLSHLTADAILADLPAATVCMAPSALGAELARAFDTQPGLPGIIIREGAKTIGVVSRQAFFRLMSGPFGREIFLKRSLAVLIQNVGSEPLELPGACPVAEA